MENLRSALDYMAHDIYEISCKPMRQAKGKSEPHNIYFPYGRSNADFKSGIGSSLPGLEICSPKTYNLLLSIQPFECGDNWLYDLCSILNESKHDRLTPQKRTETETHKVESKAASVTIRVGNVRSLPGAIKIGGVPAQFTDKGIITAPSSELTHKRVKWVAFLFEDTNVNILGLLNKAVPGITQFATSLYMQI